MIQTKIIAICLCSFVGMLFSTSISFGNSFCQTAEDFTANNVPMIESPCKNGECDSVVLRNENIPSSQTRTKTVRLFFQILRNDDGSNPVILDPSALDSQMVILNQTFAFPLDNSTS